MILVTGGSGFIGGHLVARLVSQGRPVRCLVRRSSSVRNLPRDGIEIVYGDLASGNGLAEAVDGVETVIHLAGTTKARTAGEYHAGNADATANLLRVAGRGQAVRACQQHGGGRSEHSRSSFGRRR